MHVIKILNNNDLYAPSGMNPTQAYGPDGVSPFVPKNCISADTLPAQTLSSLRLSICLSFLLEAESMRQSVVWIQGGRSPT